MTDQSADSGGNILRVASYNIHQGVGGDGKRDLKRVATVINHLDADVVALQEVHVRFGAGEQGRQLEFLAEETGLLPICGATMLRPDGHYGNAVLVRSTIMRERLHDLSFPGREPRGVIDLLLDTQLGPVRLLATHLGLRPNERRYQVRRLLAWINAAQHPVIVAGDLNEWFPWGRSARWLARCFPAQRSPRTFPARRPLFGLDRIFAAPPLRIPRMRAIVQPPARLASDHLPLLAEIERGLSVSAPQHEGANGEQGNVTEPRQ